MNVLGFWQGKFAEAEKQVRTAIKVEPLSAINYADLAWTLHATGSFEEALAVAKTGIELDNNSFLAQRMTALCYMAIWHCSSIRMQLIF